MIESDWQTRGLKTKRRIVFSCHDLGLLCVNHHSELKNYDDCDDDVGDDDAGDDDDYNDYDKKMRREDDDDM